MKRTLTLLIVLLSSWGITQAQERVDQTFVFADSEGNVIPDGAVITVDVPDDDQMNVPLYVKNTSGQDAAASIYEEISQMPHGVWQTCAFGNCLRLNGSGYSPKNVVEANYFKSIQTEWLVQEGEYAEWTATLQIHVFNIETKTLFGQEVKTAGNDIIGYGPKVTVHFVYSDASHIHGIRTSASEANAVFYAPDGRIMNHPRHGINIVKDKNGKVRKFIQ